MGDFLPPIDYTGKDKNILRKTIGDRKIKKLLFYCNYQHFNFRIIQKVNICFNI